MHDTKDNNQIQRIPAETIKQYLIESGLENPMKNICSITAGVFAQISCINGQSYIDAEWAGSFLVLERVFEFNQKLLKELS